jgi:hypothetical protein
MSENKPSTPPKAGGWPPSEIVTGKPIERARRFVEEHGQFILTENREAACQELINDWAVSAAADPRGHVVYTDTTSEAWRMSNYCQLHLIFQGYIRSPGLGVGDGDHSLVIHTGDRVLLTRTREELGVEAGDLGTVLGYDGEDRSLRVKLDRDGTEVNVPTTDPRDIRLGYALTHREGWGRDIEHAYVLGDHRLSGANFVSSDSQIRVFTDWPSVTLSPEVKEWLKDLARREQVEVTPVADPKAETWPTTVPEVER